MTHTIQHFGKAMTAIAAVLAFSTAPTFAQEIGAPPDPIADTSVQTPDPLAPEPAAQSPAATDTATPPAPKPKVEATKATTQRAKASTSRSTTARSTTRRATATAPAAAAAAPVAEAAAPAPAPAAAPMPVAAQPAPPPVAEPAPAADTSAPMPGLLTEEMLPMTGAAALGLIALAGAVIAMRRRKRRRENEEFEARQQALAAIDAEPTMELDQAAEVRPEPAFAGSPVPIHDPVPAFRPDADFMFRRAGKDVKHPVEHN